MRFILAVLLFIGVAHCNPFRDRFSFDDEASDDDRHERQFNPFGFGPNFGGHGFGFDSDSDEDSDNRRPQTNFQEQFNTLLKALSDALNKSTSDVNKLPPNFHNSTSTKEVVNGSVVTINETIDKQTDDNNNTFFVDTKIVDVQPSVQPEIATNAAETTAPTMTTMAPVEATMAPAETTMAPAETTMAPVETTMAAVEMTTGPSGSTTRSAEEPSSSPARSTESPLEATSSTPLTSTSFPNQIFNELSGPSKGPEFL